MCKILHFSKQIYQNHTMPRVFQTIFEKKNRNWKTYRFGERQARSQGQTALASVRSEGDKPNFKQLANDIIEECDVDGSETLNAAEAFACIEANEDKIRE